MAQGDADSEVLLFDRSAGGGSLLDVGVYPLSLAFNVCMCYCFGPAACSCTS